MVHPCSWSQSLSPKSDITTSGTGPQISTELLSSNMVLLLLLAQNFGLGKISFSDSGDVVSNIVTMRVIQTRIVISGGGVGLVL